jgi:hypothetical protein
VLVDCRGLESALEAVRVSVEVVRVSVEAVRVSIEALRCFRGRERLEEVPENVNCGCESVAEAKKVPVEVVREPVGKTGTNQNVLVLFQNFLIKWKSSAFVLKILAHM